MTIVKFLKREPIGVVGNIWLWKVENEFHIGYEYCPFDSQYDYPLQIVDNIKEALNVFEGYFERRGEIGKETKQN